MLESEWGSVVLGHLDLDPEGSKHCFGLERWMWRSGLLKKCFRYQQITIAALHETSDMTVLATSSN